MRSFVFGWDSPDGLTGPMGRGDMVGDHEPLVAVLDALSVELTRVLGAVDEIAEEVAAILGVPRWRRRQPPLAVLDPLEATARRHLEQPGALIWGLGFVAAPEVFAGGGGLAWWQRSGPGGRVERLRVSLDPASVDFYDYTRAPWYTNARDRGLNITGPYVDATGTNEYIVTTTRAVRIEDRFVGVAGADVRVGSLQSTLQPLLVAIPSEASVVDGEGRVIVTNTPNLLAAVISETQADDLIVEVPFAPWRLVVRRAGQPASTRARRRSGSTGG